MNCPYCGNSNPDTASICANCGKPLSGAPPHSYTPPAPPPQAQTSYIPPPAGAGYGVPPPGQPIPNYLVQSILVTICCCLPLGIVAIVFSAQVNSKLAAGDIEGAREASKRAKMICWIALAIGIVLCIVYGIWLVTGGMAILEGIRDGMAHR